MGKVRQIDVEESGYYELGVKDVILYIFGGCNNFFFN